MSVKILPPGPIQNELCVDGKQRLLRNFIVEIDGKKFVCPEGLIYDGSSWPRCLPGPRQFRILAAGCVHDEAFQEGTHGRGGGKVTFLEANGLWYKMARAGSHPGARAGWFWGRVGWLGLLFSWPTWLRYRWADEEVTE